MTTPQNGTILPGNVGEAKPNACPSLRLSGRVWRNENQQKNKTKKSPWRWDSIHQAAFDNIEATITKEAVLAYPDFSKTFEIYTDASTLTIGSSNQIDRSFFSVGDYQTHK